MTSIERLQISGIRSFEPSLSNRQTIYFQKPLTVILGKNGAGKTTIIEALLNACSGIMPPGSGQEKFSFIYDPQIIGENEVKAQIRLVFAARDGKMVQVIRSFKVTRIKNKTSFSTLDNTVAYEDSITKKVISSTYKASQVDRVIPEMLGVSPAVLEHVIFCHQEASNWPLSSPLEVKKIFDEIFSATRYVLALERFRESGKEYRQELKEQEGNLRELREHREQAQHLRALVEKKKKVVEDIRQRICSTHPRLEKLQSVLSALKNVDQQTEELIREASVMEGRVQERREALQRVANGVEKDYLTEEEFCFLKNDSFERVQQRCHECQERTAELSASLDALHNQLKKLEERSQAATANLQCHNNKVHELEKKEYQHHQHCSDFRALVSSSTKGLPEELFVDEQRVNESIARKTLQAAKASVVELQHEYQKEIHRLEEAIEAEEGTRLTLLRQLDVNVKEREMKQELIDQFRHRIEATQTQLRRVVETGANESPSFSFESDIFLLQAEIESEEKQIAVLKEAKKQGPCFQSVQQVQKDLELQSAKVSQLRDLLGKLRALSLKDAERKVLERRLMERRHDFLSQLSHLPPLFPCILSLYQTENDEECGGKDEENLKNKYHSAVLQIECSLQKASEQYASSSEELTKLQQVLFTKADRQTKFSLQITDYEAELASVREKLMAEGLKGVLSGNDCIQQYESCLQEAAEKKERLDHELHVLQAKFACFSALWSHASTSKTCPLCQRAFDFESGGEPQSFFSHEKVSSEDILSAERDSAAAAEAWRHLHSLRAHIDTARMIIFQIEKLREQQHLEHNEYELDKLTSKLHELESQTMDDKNCLEEVQTARNLLISLSGTVAEIESLESESRRMTRQRSGDETDNNLDCVSSGLREVHKRSPKLSVEETMDLYEAAMAAQKDLHTQLSAYQKELDGDVDVISDLEKVVQQKKQELFALEAKERDRKNLESAAEKLIVEMEEWKSKCEGLAQQLPLLQSSLTQSTNALKVLREEKTAAEDAGKQRILAAQEYASHLELAVEKVFIFVHSSGFQQLQEEREKVTQCELAVKQFRDQLCLLHSEMETTRGDQKKNEGRLKILLHYRDIRVQETSLHADEERLTEINEKLEALKGSKLYGVEDILGPEAQKAPLSQLRENIREKIRQLEKTKSQHEGNMETLQEDVEQLSKELGSEKYCDIDKRYGFTFVQVETTSMTIKDIDKYYFALATAVQSYHQEKMTLINRIIGDLWRQTYLGSDIDTIEIRSETEKTFQSGGRRNYNYRVIMKRGSREIDMRGRCSAGQKVLASIIIRLALSEVFCYDCGILALDEPTTNLDEENSRSLAEALRVLIESRRSVRHFQLIVITHDEQFVRALGGHAVDRFYFILKDREGAFSVIEERTFDQLFI